MTRTRIFTPSLALSVAALMGACDGREPLAPPHISTSLRPSTTLTATAVSTSQIDLAWQDISSNESGYEVFRSTSGAGGTLALSARTGANVTTYGDLGLTASTQYCYQVRAFRTTGSNTSYTPFSAVACATTPAPPAPPAAPFDLTAEAVTWQIVLQWIDNSADFDGFKVERCVGLVCGDTDFTVIATTTTRSYGDYGAGLAGGTTFTYRVRAFNRAGDSTPSNEASATACFVELADDGTYYCRTP